MNIQVQHENLPELWDITLQYLYGSGYIDGLDDFLRKYNIRTILDCACGTGFPAIELIKKGYEVSCSDLDKKMLKFLKEKAKKEQLSIPVFEADWEELPEVFQNRFFDCVMCRGNSLIYATSWADGRVNPQKTRNKIEKSLGSMFDCLKATGILYVDVFSQEEIDKVLAGGEKFVEKFGRRKTSNEDMELIWEISYNQKDRIRTVHSIRKILNKDGSIKQIKEHCYEGYLLMPGELRQMIQKTGFSKVFDVKINGEICYDVFVGVK